MWQIGQPDDQRRQGVRLEATVRVKGTRLLSGYITLH